MSKFLGRSYEQIVAKAQQKEKDEAENRRVVAEKKKIEDELADAELIDEKETIDELALKLGEHRKAYKKKKDNVKKRQAQDSLEEAEAKARGQLSQYKQRKADQLKEKVDAEFKRREDKR